jgi:hypothetical protein
LDVGKSIFQQYSNIAHLARDLMSHDSNHNGDDGFSIS